MSLSIQSIYGSLSEVLPDSKSLQQHIQRLAPISLKVAKIAAIYLAVNAVANFPAASAGVLSYNACVAGCSGLLGPVCIAACLPLMHPALP